MNEQREHWLEGGGLGVRFFRRDDRVAHEIGLAVSGGWTVVLASCEGSAEDEWPPSPPLQPVHIAAREGNRQVALLVGMAGKSHWSASIELDPTLGSLVFDVACRRRPGDLGPLESRYRLLRPPREFNHERAVFDGAGAQRLIIECSDASESSRISTDAEELRVLPTAVQPGVTAQTVRWAYRIALA